MQAASHCIAPREASFPIHQGTYHNMQRGVISYTSRHLPQHAKRRHFLYIKALTTTCKEASFPIHQSTYHNMQSSDSVNTPVACSWCCCLALWSCPRCWREGMYVFCVCTHGCKWVGSGYCFVYARMDVNKWAVGTVSLTPSLWGSTIGLVVWLCNLGAGACLSICVCGRVYVCVWVRVGVGVHQHTYVHSRVSLHMCVYRSTRHSRYALVCVDTRV